MNNEDRIKKMLIHFVDIFNQGECPDSDVADMLMERFLNSTVSVKCYTCNGTKIDYSYDPDMLDPASQKPRKCTDCDENGKIRLSYREVIRVDE
jgi:hypothetical protein